MGTTVVPISSRWAQTYRDAFFPRYAGRTYADSVDIDGRVLFTAAGLVPAGEFVWVRREAADQGGADHHVGDGGPELGEQVLDLRPGAAAAHGLQRLVPAGEFVWVRITGVSDGDLTGEIEE